MNHPTTRPPAWSCERMLLNAPEVALKLKHSLTWFARNRERLETEHGFPRPIDGVGRRWDPVAIDRWLDLQLPEHLRAPTGPAELERAEQEYWDQILHERAEAISRGEPMPPRPPRRWWHGGSKTG